MSYPASAFRSESSSELTLMAILEPIADKPSTGTYRQTVLDTAESSYLHKLISGEDFLYS